MSLRVVFIGVGEAFDERLDNCSLLVSHGPSSALLDCGFTAPFAFWRHAPDPLGLDANGGAAGSLFYSGDGRPTEATRALARGCGLVVHEAYALDADTPGHGTVSGTVDFARQAGAAALALVHINRRDRRERRDEVQRQAAASQGLPTLIPEPGLAMDAPPASVP